MAIQRMHLNNGNESLKVSGLFVVKHSKNLFAKILLYFLNMPKCSDNVAVKLCITKKEGNEVWNRLFDKTEFTTVQWNEQELLVEQIGSILLYFKLIVHEEILLYEHKYTKMKWGFRLPMCLSPKVYAKEFCYNNEVTIYVKVTVPLIGMLITYEGTLFHKR